MNEGSKTRCRDRDDEWGNLLILVMRTSLSVAHELGLPPDAALDCAARHLRFHDFQCLASAIQGASRAYACCRRRDVIRTLDVTYIKTLAARVENDRGILACLPTMCGFDPQDHHEASIQAYEKVAAALEAFEDDVQRAFSLESGAPGVTAVERASDFAKKLAAITDVGDAGKAFDSALAAVMHVRFNAVLDAGRVLGAEKQPTAVQQPTTMGALNGMRS